jgi:phosphoadenosine phosphosulfate reductase
MNVPLLLPECPGCERDDVFEVRIGEPGDARPAFAEDYSRLRQALVNETGSDRLYRRLFEGRLVLLNRIPYMDEMKEVIVDGGHAGKLYYDPYQLRWRFRFSRWSARYAVEEGAVETVRLAPGEKPGPVISLGGRRLEEESQVVVLDSRGEPVAIAYYRRGAVRLQTRLGGELEPLEGAPRSTLDDAVRANEYAIYYLESRAKTFLSVMAGKLSGKPVIVSFSGGKDSLVSLDLALKADLDPKMLFNDTGLELPETVKTVEETARRLGVDLYVASAGDRFWRVVGVYGPPGKDYRWCCKVVKLAPIARLTKRLWGETGALNVVGVRAYESLDRARSPRVWRNRWLPWFLSVTPIHEWSQLAVWLYVLRYRLPYNPLYEMGYERIGCFMCPASYLAEFALVREKHPELWNRWWSVLEEWRRKLGLPPEWSTHGLWRWHGPATQRERLARRVGVRLPSWRSQLQHWAGVKPVSARLEPKLFEVVLSERLSPRALIEQASILASKPVQSSEGRVVLERRSLWRLSFDGRRLAVESLGGMQGERLWEEGIDALKLIYRWSFCSRCRACETVCPMGAVRVTDRPTVDPNLCVACRVCIDTCPIAEVYFEHVVAPLIFNDPLAWKRPSKRKIEEVVEKEKALIGAPEAVETSSREPEHSIPPSVFEA